METELKAGIDNLLRSKDAELADVTNSRDIWARKARNLEQQLEELQDNQEEQEQSRGIHGHR